MSEEQGGLYYEISLTSRQVLMGILVMLGCVMVAFLSGVWIGRGAAPEIPTFAETPAEPLDAAGVDFFEPSADEPVEGGSGSSAAGDESTEGAPPVVAQASSPVETPQFSRVVPHEPDEPDESDESNESAKQAEARDEAEERAPAAPPQTPASSAEPAAGPGSVVIQVFSSHDEKQAESILERLRSAGVRAFLSPEDVSGKRMYRVRVGPFGDRAVAEAEAGKLRRQYRLDTWITAYEG